MLRAGEERDVDLCDPAPVLEFFNIPMVIQFFKYPVWVWSYHYQYIKNLLVWVL